MTERSATHATFTIDRTYDAVPARVFHAYSDPAARKIWFAGGDAWNETVREDDFRVGSGDRLVGKWADGNVTQFDSRYHDIVPNERIIMSYDMHLNGTKISVSLATVEFKPAGAGTRLTFTEQLVCLDGYDDPDGRSREHGTRSHLDNIAAYLQREPANAQAR
jgi:uncharacterized protein YndB with AHSA1/START domain